MMQWTPSWFAKKFAPASTTQWRISIEEGQLVASDGSRQLTGAATEVFTVTAKYRLPWSRLELSFANSTMSLGALSWLNARRIVDEITRARADVLERQRLDLAQTHINAAADQLLRWGRELSAACGRQLQERGWLTREFSADWHARRIATGFGALLDDASLAPLVAVTRHENPAAFATWERNLDAYIADSNRSHRDSMLAEHNPFFTSVEKSPLTSEQAEAVVCFDNRILLVAAAGLGKTSTLVAKAGYAMRRQLVAPEKILMLAFNNHAAKELKNRTVERLSPLGLPAERVMANTFHSLGLAIIGKATGRKPPLASWLNDSDETRELARIVATLRASDRDFGRRWDLFRLLLARPDGDRDDDKGIPPRGAPGQVFTTAKNEIVRSSGERLIADWLYFHGVEYNYERAYEHDTVDDEHSQYRPDFYYPAIDVYHEHWALEADGLPPPEFEGYADGMRWKRALHARHGTTLLQTTKAALWDGQALDNLADELTRRGIELVFDPERAVTGDQPVANERLLGVFNSFLKHAKGNRLDDAALRERVNRVRAGRTRLRDEQFLWLFARIRAEWDRRLAAEGAVDFEDMLNTAADHVENGDWESPYELVMVDESQDASVARARLVKALVAGPGRHLLAVGDDWQSINRFAGADLSVMTNFEQWFGDYVELRLERTFRFPQSLADASSSFVLKNSQQIRKTVRSSTPEFPPTIEVRTAASEAGLAPAIRNHLVALSRGIESGEISRPRDRRASVYVLGRYRKESELLAGIPDLSATLDVRFLTIHASKGAEADYVVVPSLLSGRARTSSGFPSAIEDDPVLRHAMPVPESHPHAEERRLLYVALTRARRSVLLLTVQKLESPFLLELVRDLKLPRVATSGDQLNHVLCPRCDSAYLALRAGKHGRQFWGCEGFPACRHTESIKPAVASVRSRSSLL